MGLSSALASLLFCLRLFGICTGFRQDTENCHNYSIQFERVFSVPGDVAMLNSTLVSPDVFNITTVPYNITWYSSKSGLEINDQTGRILVRGETLWFLNVTMDDDGEYVTVLRTPSKCAILSTQLIVDQPVKGKCGRPRTAHQSITNEVDDTLRCPLKPYMENLKKNFNITASIKWYRDCDLIVEGKGSKYTIWDETTLAIERVEPEDAVNHTCTLTFSIGGIVGSVSETIDVDVKVTYYLVPEVREPANEIIKAQRGSNFSKSCQVFVPSVGIPDVDIFWLSKDRLIHTTNSSHRVYTSKQRMWHVKAPRKGAWLEKVLMFSELRKEDFNINYTCQAFSARGAPKRYFTLLQTDPDVTIPIGLVLSGVMVMFVISVTFYYIFKIDIVLWFRRAFPIFYTNTDSDGKLYDAYVAYPQPQAFGFKKEVETFALHTLPQVLEKACDYKLFIAGRDCLPGQAVVDSIEENLQASRCFLLLYNASTFSSTSSSNNNNICKTSECSDKKEMETSFSSSSLSLHSLDKLYPDTRQELECVDAMHRALLDKSLKVVLVELEEISPAQLAHFPESLRYLRKKQGAVCWWKYQRRTQKQRMCMRSREGEEMGENGSQDFSSLSPSSRFWKEMRYCMPVRGKRKVYPEKTALLNE
ncbi:interleukin-1 receptor type 1-like isoform 2-T3 [Pholidichthys leucotaenia]